MIIETMPRSEALAAFKQNQAPGIALVAYLQTLDNEHLDEALRHLEEHENEYSRVVTHYASKIPCARVLLTEYGADDLAFDLTVLSRLQQNGNYGYLAQRVAGDIVGSDAAMWATVVPFVGTQHGSCRPFLMAYRQHYLEAIA